VSPFSSSFCRRDGPARERLRYVISPSQCPVDDKPLAVDDAVFDWEEKLYGQTDFRSVTYSNVATWY
jgi:hypothetical protein